MTSASPSATAQSSTLWSSLAHDWWDPQGPMRALHAITPARLESLAQACNAQKEAKSSTPLRQHVNQKKIFDLGAGAGLASLPFARLGAKVVAIDMNTDLLTSLADRANREALEISTLQADVTTSQSLDSLGCADIITCFDMIEHVDTPQAVMDTIARALAPNGIAVLSTLNRTWASSLFGIHVAERFLQLVPQGSHSWDQFIKPSELRRMGLHSGLRPIFLTGIAYNPLDNTARLSQAPHALAINYAMAFIKDAEKKS